MARAHVLIALLLVLALAPGCVDGPTDGDATDGDAGDEGEPRTYEQCDSVVVPYEANGTQWEAGRLECEANVAGTNTVQPSCGDPEEAELTASADLASGHVQIVVEDAEGQIVGDHRVDDTSGDSRDLSLQPGAAGEWTLTGERPEGFEGTYQLELACPQS